MIPTYQEMLKKMMRRKKADLRKELRKTAIAANRRLRDWQSSGVWEKVDIRVRDVISSLTRPNRGRLVSMPKHATKKELIKYIQDALVVLDLREPQEDDKKVPEFLVEISDALKEEIDQSEFWRVYWAHTPSGDSTERRDVYIEHAKEKALEARTTDEFWTSVEKTGSRWM